MIDSADLDRMQTTVPDHVEIHVQGLEDEQATVFRSVVVEFLKLFGKAFDLSQLDGVTVAFEYAKALRELDRGVATSRPLAPSSGDTFGVGMTPTVLRDGVNKSHIVLNAHYILPLADPEGHPEDFKLALHLLAHECAHVDLTRKFDDAFPGVLLRYPPTPRQSFRWGAIMACWEEYAATLLSARFGASPTEHYPRWPVKFPHLWSPLNPPPKTSLGNMP